MNRLLAWEVNGPVATLPALKTEGEEFDQPTPFHGGEILVGGQNCDGAGEIGTPARPPYRTLAVRRGCPPRR